MAAGNRALTGVSLGAQIVDMLSERNDGPCMLVDPSRLVTSSTGATDFHIKLLELAPEAENWLRLRDVVYIDMDAVESVDNVRGTVLTALLRHVKTSDAGGRRTGEPLKVDLLAETLEQWFERNREPLAAVLESCVLVISDINDLSADHARRTARTLTHLMRSIPVKASLILSSERRVPDLPVIRVALPTYDEFIESIRSGGHGNSQAAARGTPATATDAYASAQLRSYPSPAAGASADASANSPRGFWYYVFREISRVLGIEAGAADERREQQTSDASIAREPSRRTIHELIYKASFPSWPLKERILRSLQKFIASPRYESVGPGLEYEKMVRSSALQSVNSIVFIKILGVAFPELMDATTRDPEGVYYLHLILSEYSGRSLQPEEASALDEKEPWRLLRRDARLRNCCRYALGEPACDEQPLVTPFVSTQALQTYLDDVATVGGDRFYRSEEWNTFVYELNDIVRTEIDERIAQSIALRQNVGKLDADIARTLDSIVRMVREARGQNVPLDTNGVETAVDSIARQVDEKGAAVEALAQASKVGRSDKLDRWIEKVWTFLSALRGELGDMAPTEAMIFAQRCAAVLEIQYAGSPLAGSDASGSARFDACEEAFHHAADRSQGAICFEALNGLARSYGLRASVSTGLQQARARANFDLTMRDATRIAQGTAERHTCLELTLASVDEFERRFESAKDKYREIFKRCIESDYRELAARAGYSASRLQYAMSGKDERRNLFWAQGYLRLYEARSPRLTREHKGVFVSYRRDNQSFVQHLVESFNGDAVKQRAPDVEVWADFQNIAESNVDFRAEMQLGLDRAYYVVLVFSADYFDSHWCTYELTTTLARKRLNDQRVAWICVDPSCTDETRIGDPRQRVRDLAELSRFWASDEFFYRSQLDAVLGQPPLFDKVIRDRSDAELKDVAADVVNTWLRMSAP